jgi:hypothetical protein
MASSQMLSSCRISCQEEQRKMVNLHREEIRLKKLVREFKNNDEEYLKIKKTVEKAVTNILFDAKGILRLSLFSLIESMRTDPQGYCNLIHYNRSSSAGNIDQHNAGQYIHGQQPYLSYDYFFEQYKATLLENAEKLFNKSAKEWTEQIMTEYSIKNSSSQFFRSDMERQQLHHKPSNRLSLPTAISNNQTYSCKREERVFVKTEF